MNSLDIGALVRQVRKSQHLTQEALAAAANVSTRYIHDLERGKPTAALGLALAVLAALGIEVRLLLPYSGEGPGDE